MASTTARRRPLHVAVVGAGGFALDHHAALETLEERGMCRVVATCDPSREKLDAVASKHRLKERGIRRYESLEALLVAVGSELDVVTLPTPIPLHAAQHRAVLGEGLACYLEKPPSLWLPELDEMIDLDRVARIKTNVGFNFVADPMRRELKQCILDGEFGRLREVSLLAFWPRDAAYYQRNDWAGRLRCGDHVTLDSPIGNAVSHYVHNLLFWGGLDSVDAIGMVQEARAWVGHKHPIQSFDTALVEAQLSDGVVLRIGATHASEGAHWERETVVLDDAVLTFDRSNRVRIDRRGSASETLESSVQATGGMLAYNLAEYLGYAASERSRPVTTLEDSRSLVTLVNLALMSSRQITRFTELPDLAGFVGSGSWPVAPGPWLQRADLTRLPALIDGLCALS